MDSNSLNRRAAGTALTLFVAATMLSAGCNRGAQKADNGTWLSSKNWVAEYQRNKHQRIRLIRVI